MSDLLQINIIVGIDGHSENNEELIKFIWTFGTMKAGEIK